MPTDSSPPVSSTDDDHDPTPTVPGPSTNPLTDEPSTRVPDRPFHDKPTADGFLRCGCSSKGRNLVVCIDGTANQFSEKNTNIVELYSRLIKDDSQLTYYNSGIGTYARPSWFSWSRIKQWVNHSIDMAIAWNFERIVLSAYQWLSENHKEGDRIFLFGFSRGAYQARVIAGMINKVGLLHKGNNDQIPFAYELYMATTATSTRGPFRKKPNSLEKAERLCDRFKSTLSKPNIKVHFVGAWDTVSSIGITRGPSLPETTTGMTHVCYFRHALALDELRIKFMPEYANGGAGIPEVERGLVRRGDVKEVWFPGSHSDIGGGNVENTNLNLFGPSLRWESYEGIQCGLKMEPYKGEWGSITPVKSLTGIWKLLELWPFRRLTYKDEDSTTYWPHLGGARIVQKGQLIHESVLDAIGKLDGYRPCARFHDGTNWEGLTHQSKLIEQDPFTSAMEVITQLPQLPDPKPSRSFDAQIHVLATLSSSDVGLRSITEVPDTGSRLLSTLETERQRENQEPEQCQAVIIILLRVLAKLPPQPPKERKYTISKLQELASVSRPLDKGHQQLIFKVCRNFGKPLLHGPFEWRGSSIPKYCAFSCDGNHVLSGSDSSWAIWEEGTDKPEQKSYGEYTEEVRSVAFSADGTRIATGLGDGTVLVWDSSTGKVVKGPLKGHAKGVYAIAFSPDGTCIASGSLDSTIRVWDVMTGEVIGPLEGHTYQVRCVAFSPDGTRIVSGSGDNTIRVWDVKTGNEVMGPLWGHTHWVLAVAYSPDGTRIASGSLDDTFRVWDAKTGLEVMKPLEGHTSAVLAVAYSLDERRIASGSEDGTIRVWDTTTGKILGVLNVGSDVWSVAFSPDGKRIVSGSYNFDNERSFVHIWDAENPELWPDS